MDYTDLYIDGGWHKGASGDRFDVLNPATEKVIASVASADIADADAALDASEAAMKKWAAQTPRHRSHRGGSRLSRNQSGRKRASVSHSRIGLAGPWMAPNHLSKRCASRQDWAPTQRMSWLLRNRSTNASD